MASNLVQKNIIFQDEKFSKIPFGNVNKIDLYSEDNNINNMVVLNNTYNQMIQNDKYVSSEIDVRSDETIGPKSDDSDMIYDGPNGYKFYQIEDGDPYIYQKVDTPLQQTFTKFPIAESTKFSFMQVFGTDSIIYSNTSRSYYSGQVFKSLTINPLYYHYDLEKYQKSTETGSDYSDVQIYCCSNSDQKFLGGTYSSKGAIFIYEDTGLYFLNEDGTLKQNSDGTHVKLGRYLKLIKDFRGTSVPKVTAIEYNEKTKRMAFATTQYVYLCDVTDDLTLKNITEIHQMTDSDEVVSIKFLSEGYLSLNYEIMVLTKKRRLYYSSVGTVFEDLNYLQLDASKPLPTICFDINSVQYYCLSDGVYSYSAGKISGTAGHDFTMFYKGSDRVLLKDTGGVYSFDGTTLTEMGFLTSYLSDIKSIFCIGSDTVGCFTSNKIIYNGDSGVFSGNAKEIELDCLLTNFTVENIISKEIQGEQYTCFTSLSNSTDTASRQLAYVKVESDSESEYDTDVTYIDPIQKLTMSIESGKFNKIERIGDRKYLIYTDTSGYLNFVDVTTQSFTKTRLFGIDCIGFTSYGNAGYVFAINSIYVFSGLGSQDFSYVQIPHQMTITGNIDSAVVDSSTEGYTDSTNCKMVVMHDSKVDLLNIVPTQATVLASYNSGVMTYKSSSDPLNVNGLFMWLNGSGNLVAYSKGDTTQDLEIHSSVESLYSGGKIIKDFSVPGYEATGDDNYNLVTYVNTDKAYKVVSQINTTAELTVLAGPTYSDSGYAYAHIETANANAGLFRTTGNATYLRYCRFNTGDKYSVTEENMDTFSLDTENINLLQSKYISDNDYLNSASPDCTVTNLDLGSSTECGFISYKNGSFNTTEDGTEGSITDTCYTYQVDAGGINVSKIDCNTNFSVTDYNEEEEEGEEGEEEEIGISTDYQVIGTTITRTVYKTYPSSTAFAFSNQSFTVNSEGDNVILAYASGTNVKIQSISFTEDPDPEVITVAIGQEIKGIYRYQENKFLVLTSTRLYEITASGEIASYSTLISSGDTLIGIFSMMNDDGDTSDDEGGSDSYPLEVQKIGSYSVFFNGSNQQDKVIIGSLKYYDLNEDSGLVSETLTTAMTGYSAIRDAGDDNAIFLKSGSNPIVEKITFESGSITQENAEMTAFGNIIDIECDNGQIGIVDSVVDIQYPVTTRQTSDSKWKINLEVDDVIKSIELNGSASATSICQQTEDDPAVPVFVSSGIMYTAAFPHKNVVTYETIITSTNIDDDAHEIGQTIKHIYLDNSTERIILVIDGSVNLRVDYIDATTGAVETVASGYDEYIIPDGIRGRDAEGITLGFIINSTDRTLDVYSITNSGTVKMSEIADFGMYTTFGFYGYNKRQSQYYLSFGDTYKKIMSFSGISKDSTHLTLTRDEDDFTSDFGNGLDIIPYSDDNYILLFQKDIYNYQFEVMDGKVVDFEYMVLSASSTFGWMSRYETNTSSQLLLGDGRSILTSTNSRTWNTLYTLTQIPNTSVIERIYFKNKRDILCLVGTGNDDIWYSNYQYTIVNNTPKFTESDALEIFDSQQDQIQATIDASIGQHEVTEHQQNKPIDIINQYMSVKPEFPDDFTTTNAATDSIDISSDYIYTILTGDSSDEVMTVGVRNTACGNTSDKTKRKSVSNISYIAKCWNSGMVDLYIHIPTTYTYYIPHIEYAGYCTIPDTTVRVNGKTLSADIKNNYTTITLNILSTYFHMDQVIDNTIKGTSLPLKIFKGTEYQDEEGDAALMFHSFMEPSVSELLDSTTLTAPYDSYSFNYYCFGTDEQNIQLRFYDTQKNYLKKYKTVIYHGREGTDENGNDTVKQRILDDDVPKAVLGEGLFTLSTGKFIGWTTSKKETNTPNFTRTTISYNDENVKFSNGILHLYAIWMHYTFSEKDTIVELDATANQNYTVAQVEITPNMEIDGYNLKNQLIVDWDSDTNA